MTLRCPQSVYKATLAKGENTTQGIMILFYQYLPER